MASRPVALPDDDAPPSEPTRPAGRKDAKPPAVPLPNPRPGRQLPPPRLDDPDAAPPPLPPGAFDAALAARPDAPPDAARVAAEAEARALAEADAADAKNPQLSVRDRARRMLERRLPVLGRCTADPSASWSEKMSAVREMARIAAAYDSAPPAPERQPIHISFHVAGREVATADAPAAIRRAREPVTLEHDDDDGK